MESLLRSKPFNCARSAVCLCFVYKTEGLTNLDLGRLDEVKHGHLIGVFVAFFLLSLHLQTLNNVGISLKFGLTL